MPQGSYRVYYVEICGHNTVRILQPDDMSCEGQARLVDLRPESRHAKSSQPTASQGHRTPRKATQAKATQGTPRHDKPRHGSETLQKCRSLHERMEQTRSRLTHASASNARALRVILLFLLLTAFRPQYAKTYTHNALPQRSAPVCNVGALYYLQHTRICAVSACGSKAGGIHCGSTAADGFCADLVVVRK